MLREHEPTLEDLLNDALVRQVMASDGYNPDDVRQLFKMIGTHYRPLSTLFGCLSTFVNPQCELRQPAASPSRRSGLPPAALTNNISPI